MAMAYRRFDPDLPAGWSEREAAVWLRDRSNVIGGCLPSLTLTVGRNVLPAEYEIEALAARRCAANVEGSRQGTALCRHDCPETNRSGASCQSRSEVRKITWGGQAGSNSAT